MEDRDALSTHWTGLKTMSFGTAGRSLPLFFFKGKWTKPLKHASDLFRAPNTTEKKWGLEKTPSIVPRTKREAHPATIRVDLTNSNQTHTKTSS